MGAESRTGIFWTDSTLLTAEPSLQLQPLFRYYYYVVVISRQSFTMYIYSSGCLEIHSVVQAGLELIEIQLPLPPKCWN